MMFPHDVHVYLVDGDDRIPIGIFNLCCTYEKWEVIKTIYKSFADFSYLAVTFDEFQKEKDAILNE